METQKTHQNTNLLLALVGAIVLLFIIGFIVQMFQNKNESLDSTPIAVLSYACDQNKRIDVAFFDGRDVAPVVADENASTTADAAPVPTGSVDLKLSDGRSMTLLQTISADGARFANDDESFVFWAKGNGALVLENNSEKSYIGCIGLVEDLGGLEEVYHSNEKGFTLRYPTGYSVKESYAYQGMGPGKSIAGTQFTIPQTLKGDTNLSSDTYLSVEQFPRTPADRSCTADLFLDGAPTTEDVTEGMLTYSMASASGAGAGNRYEETVYAIPGTNPCVAIRYRVHYGVLANYPEGTVREFDAVALKNQFDQIRRTLVVNQ